MYTLLDGTKVKNLQFREGFGNWLVSQYYWYNGEKVQQAYNTETGEIKVLNAKGETIYNNI